MKATLARLGRLSIELGHETDARLLERFLGGCERSFRELVDRHGPLVFSVCNRVLRHRQDAEDAFQAAFLVLARRAADVWPREAIGSWLYGVAYRVAQKARVARARRTCRERMLHDLPHSEDRQSEPDTAAIVETAVNLLPRMYRAAIVACDLEGQSRKAAAGQLGWSEGTLSGRLARARQLLADRLRKSGVALPAGGLVAVLGSSTQVRARVAEQVLEFISSSAECVPAPVLQLSEEVVSSMFALKLKALAAAAMVACAVGFGAWAAGAGDKSGDAAMPAGPHTVPLAAEGQAQPKLAAPPKNPSPLDPLQGKWRIISIQTAGQAAKTNGIPGSVMEIKGATLAMPYRETGGKQKSVEYKIAVDAGKSPKTIDLIASNKPVGRGIYAIMAPGTSCVTCHQPPFVAEPKLIQLGPVCTPAMRYVHGVPGVHLKLAIGTSGSRPTKFGSGDEGVIEFDLERVDVDARAEKERLSREKARIEALLESGVTEEQRRELLQTLAKQQLAAAELDVEQARLQLQVAAMRADEVQALVAQANLQFTIASRNLQAAQTRLEAARKAAPAAGKQSVPKGGEPTFTIHIRTQLAPEEVRWVMLADGRTVLEALAFASKDMAIKLNSLTVWIVRDKKLVRVDMTAIFRGDSEANYPIKAGDQLFIESKEAK